MFLIIDTICYLNRLSFADFNEINYAVRAMRAHSINQPRRWHQIIVITLITCNFGRIVTKLRVVVDLIDRPRSPLLLLPILIIVFAVAFSDNASLCLTYGSFIAHVEVCTYAYKFAAKPL